MTSASQYRVEGMLLALQAITGYGRLHSAVQGKPAGCETCKTRGVLVDRIRQAIKSERKRKEEL